MEHSQIEVVGSVSVVLDYQRLLFILCSAFRNRSLLTGNTTGKELALAWSICIRRLMKVCCCPFKHLF